MDIYIYIICKCIVEGQVAGSAQTFALRLKNNLIINIYHRRPWPPLSSRPLTLPLIWMLFIQNLLENYTCMHAMYSIIKLTFSSSSSSSNLHLIKKEGGTSYF